MQPIDYSTSPWGGGVIQPPIEELRVGFGLRFGALIIDFVLELVLALIIAGIFFALGLKIIVVKPEYFHQIMDIYKQFGIDTAFVRKSMDFIQLLTFAYYTTKVAYSVIEGTSGWSLGKRILGIRIAHPDGKRGNTQLYLKRWLIKDLSTILTLFTILPALEFLEFFNGLVSLILFFGCFAALGAEKLALHDRLAQTAVFRKQDIQK